MADKQDTMQFIWLEGKEDLTLPFSIRIRVFCDEQGYTPDMEIDDQDREAWHVLLYSGGAAVATGRVYWKEPGVMALGRIAVDKPWRGKGIGRLMVEEMCRKAEALGAHSLQLDAQCRARAFYEKLGFVAYGEEHMDGHVPHIQMKREIFCAKNR